MVIRVNPMINNSFEPNLTMYIFNYVILDFIAETTTPLINAVSAINPIAGATLAAQFKTGIDNLKTMSKSQWDFCNGYIKDFSHVKGVV